MSGAASIGDARGWMAGLRARAVTSRLPMGASLELTYRCNLRCRHCYLGDRTGGKDAVPERDTRAILRSLDEWAEAGVLYLLITGGDPMIRADFIDVYRHAAGLGMLIAVFCNGTLVSDRIVETFRVFPPRKVEISIYGATARTCDRVTGMPGSHERAWRGIRRLHGSGIRIALKTMLLSLNRHELDDMEAQATALGVEFRFDAAVFPALPGTPDPGSEGSEDRPSNAGCGVGGGGRGGERDAAGPIDFRVDPGTVAACDVATPARRLRLARAIRAARERPAGDRLYACGAGASFFAADPYGNLSPCLMAKQYCYPSAERDFQSIWLDDLSEIRSKRRSNAEMEIAGDLRGACSHCPAFNFLETGDEEREPAQMVETARRRYEAVRATEEGADL